MCNPVPTIGAEKSAKSFIYMVAPEGIEPSTCRLEVGCSIQLSYGATGFFCDSVRVGARV